MSTNADSPLSDGALSDHQSMQNLHDELKSLLPEAESTFSTAEVDYNALQFEIYDFCDYFSEKLANLAKSQRHHHHLQLTDDEGFLENSKMDELMSKLLKSKDKLVELLGEIKKKNSTVYTYLEIIYEQMEVDTKEFVDIEDFCLECYKLSNFHEEKLANLQKNIKLLQKQISSCKDVILQPLVSIIDKQRFPLLRRYLSGDMRRKVVDMKEEFWSDYDEILDHVDVYQLNKILDNQPQSDITIIKCFQEVRFAYWKLNKDDLYMSSGKNKWLEVMGPVMNQGEHEICWAIVSAELVSAVRHIQGRDTPKINYSAQYLVDFTKPSLRSESRPGSKHFCYACDLNVALDYIKMMGIERVLEARPFKIECEKEVSPRNSSNLGYIGGVVTEEKLEKIFPVLQHHPVAAVIPIFEPEYKYISDKIYRGATSRLSIYKNMHAVNITGWGEDNGEKFLWVRSSHGSSLGVDGYLKVSVEIMMMCLTTGKYGGYIEHPFPLISHFIYPTLLSLREEEKKREEDHC